MDFNSIIKSLDEKQIQPVYFLHGDEPYYIDVITNHIEKNILSESEKAFNQAVVYGKEVDFKQVLDLARQFPMMSERRVVIIKEAQEMRSLAELESYISNPSPHTVLAIAYKHKKLDKRTKLYKTLNKHAIVFESKPIRDYQIGGWISKYLKKYQLNIKPEAAELVGEYLGTDLSKITNELQKLVLNIEQNKTITLDDIQEYVGINKDYNIFELQNALGRKNKSKVLQIVHYFGANPKRNPVQLTVIMLYNFFMKVMVAKQHAHLEEKVLSQKIQVNPYFVKEYKNAANNYKISELRKIIRLIHEMDYKSKGYNNIRNKPNDILLDFIVKVFNLSGTSRPLAALN